ncbi:hypothetical protein [Sutcliffiella rhizosphaerae]|uniref:hypothetical protein n=1 Tax=Sutcliffiella rhizosphaerae TaxID=2880967 RepID=UPI001E659AEF|nr:hypothetical protein [Sutcliffiella rhizosphaerae]
MRDYRIQFGDMIQNPDTRLVGELKKGIIIMLKDITKLSSLLPLKPSIITTSTDIT